MARPKHILVVDDNGDVRDIIVEILLDHDYRVSPAANGALGEASVSFALHLKEAGIPVVMISESHDAIEYAEGNDLQLLRKPFRSQALYDATKTVLASGEFGQRDA